MMAEQPALMLMLSVNPDQTAATCEHCCPWWLPCYLGGARAHDVPLTFEEWLVYHLHVKIHQAQGLPS